jgi:hypothetical protein
MRILIGKDVPHIDEIDKTDLSAFFSDGKAYRHVTEEMIRKIKAGELVITEYHEEPLGNVIYLDASSQFN